MRGWKKKNTREKDGPAAASSVEAAEPDRAMSPVDDRPETGKEVIFPVTKYKRSQEAAQKPKEQAEADSGAEYEEVLAIQDLLNIRPENQAEKADGESLAWANRIAEWLFPHASDGIQNQFPAVMEEMLREKLPQSVQVEVVNFDLGEKPPVLSDLTTCSHATHGYDGIEINCKVHWQCDCDIQLKVKAPISASLLVKHFTVASEVCIVLCPIVDTFPIVGGAQIFMLSPPVVEWKFEGMAKFTEVPLLNRAIREQIQETFQRELVVPNGMYIPAPEMQLSILGGKVNVGKFSKDLTALRFPTPLAFFELGVVEAENLTAMDWNLVSANSSDPFAIVHVGNHNRQTPVIQQSLNPKWGDEGYMEFPIFNRRQLISLEVFDQDDIKNHDFIGRLDGVTIGDVLKNPGQFWDLWESEENKKAGKNSGRVKLEVLLYRLSSHKDALVKPPGKKTTSTAYMTIHVRGLRGLSESACRGAILEIGVDGADTPQLKTKKSKVKIIKPENRPGCEPEAQRMLEYLIMHHNHSVQQLSDISGLPEDIVRQAVQSRSSFQCLWLQGFSVLFDDASKGALTFTLVTAVEAKDKKIPRAELKEPLKVTEIINSHEMTWEGFMKLERPEDKEFDERDATVAGVDMGPFDLEVKLQLFGFVPHPLQ